MFTCGFLMFQSAAYSKTKEEGDSNVMDAIKHPQLKGTLRFMLDVALSRFWFCRQCSFTYQNEISLQIKVYIVKNISTEQQSNATVFISWLG